MRLLTMLLIAMTFVFVGCGSHGKRGPASSEGVCHVEKHPKNEWYRLTVNGKPAFDSWYTEDQVEKHKAIYLKKGQCH